MRNLLFASLGSLMRIAAVEHVKSTVSRLATSAGFALGGLFCGMVVFVCIIAALWTWLATVVGPVWAPLIVGAIFLVLMIGLLVAANYSWSSNTPRKALPPPPEPRPFLTDGLSSNGMTGLATAAIAGFIVGMLRRPR